MAISMLHAQLQLQLRTLQWLKHSSIALQNRASSRVQCHVHALQAPTGRYQRSHRLGGQLFAAIEHPRLATFPPDRSSNEPRIGIPDATGLHAALVSHRVQLEGQPRQLLEMTMEEGSLSVRASQLSNPGTGECEEYIIVTFHWLDTDCVPRACVLDMNRSPYPAFKRIVNLCKFTLCDLFNVS